MKKQTLFAKRVFELNSSGSKKLHVGLFIEGGKVIPGMLLWSEKSEILLTAQNWRTLMDKKGSVMSFFDRKNDTLDMKLDCEHYQTTLKGLQSELHLACFYQNGQGLERSKFMHVAAVSFAWMFAVEKAVNHYLDILFASEEEIAAFLHRCAKSKKTNNCPIAATETTAAGFSLSMLYYEMTCYETLLV